MVGRRAPGVRGLSLAAILGAKLGCGLDQVAGVEADGDRALSGGSEGAETGGAPPIGTGGDQSGGRGETGSGDEPVPPDPVVFYACHSDDAVIEVRGVRGESCWLVVLERGTAVGARCHSEAERSRGWCVVEVRYAETRDECERTSGGESNGYQSAGRVRVSEGLELELDLTLSLPELGWTSDVPFAVSRCDPNCRDQDCRDARHKKDGPGP